MEHIIEFFEKNGYIYGVSSKYEFKEWHHKLYKFTSLEKAEEWLHTEQFDFRERELCDKKRAEELLGKRAMYDFEIK